MAMPLRLLLINPRMIVLYHSYEPRTINIDEEKTLEATLRIEIIAISAIIHRYDTEATDCHKLSFRLCSCHRLLKLLLSDFPNIRECAKISPLIKRE